MYLNLTDMSEETKDKVNKALDGSLETVSIDRDLFKNLRFDDIVYLEAEDYIKENNEYANLTEDDIEDITFRIVRLMRKHKDDAFMELIKQSANIAYTEFKWLKSIEKENK